MSGIDPYDDEVARRNRKTGLMLAAAVGVVVLLFIVRFTLAGLPEDKDEWARIQQRESQSAGVTLPTAQTISNDSPVQGQEE